jgi:hypothetical protein
MPDVAPLAGVAGLTRMTAEVETHGWERLADLVDLQRLELSYITQPAQLVDLTPLRERLRWLELRYVKHLQDLSSLSFLDAHEILALEDWYDLRDISHLVRWSGSLIRLEVHRCPVDGAL